ncbi:MAG: cobalt-precorrin-6A reductase [Leptolyngbyaceae cyanobacterium CRU_2_3]|nr:cobalt-precorrin-6A reductase [Leptolyngbyaceae cyanobacterium CRU_2_3]
MRVLILGGTGEATALAIQARQLPQLEIITSLAGRTQTPLPIAGAVRVGGFGGPTGLADYLRIEQIDLLIDATHPFAAQISWNAAQAADAAAIPYLMLVRPAWEPIASDAWIEVPTVAAAAAAIPPWTKRVFLTIGRQQLAPFSQLAHLWFLIRSIDPPTSEIPMPPGHLLLDRGPFNLEQERQLLRNYQIEAIVSKNSGGDATYAKVMAARELSIPIVMIQRPAMPDAESVPDIESALAWLKQHSC